MRKVVFSLSMILVAASAFGAASPMTVNGNLVRAQVAGSCVVPAAFDLNFGPYDPIDTHNATNLDGSVAWTVRCTKNLPVTVSFNDGVNGVRRMTNGTDLLSYQLFKDNTRLLVWGSGAAGGPAPGVTGTGFLFTAVGLGVGNAGNTLTIFGRVPMAQDVSIGNYADTITATLNF